MKKFFAIILTAAMVMSMVVSASAAALTTNVESPAAGKIILPKVVVIEGENGDIIIEPTATDDTEGLTEEQLKLFVAAQEALEEAAPEDMTAIAFFYLQVYVLDANGNKIPVVEPVDLTLDISELCDVEEITEVVFMQYIDEEWVELDVELNPDRTITIKGVVEAPTAIFVK